MATDHDPEPADAVIKTVLSGLAQRLDLDDIVPNVSAHSSERCLLPGDMLLNLAADIVEASGATRGRPLDTGQIRRHHGH